MALVIGSGITIGGGINIASMVDYVTANLVLNLDAGLTSSFSGNTTWRDTVNGLSFTLSGTPTFSSNNGGYLSFAPASSQYAYSANQGFGNLSRWTVEAWHYFTNTAAVVYLVYLQNNILVVLVRSTSAWAVTLLVVYKMDSGMAVGTLPLLAVIP